MFAGVILSSTASQASSLVAARTADELNLAPLYVKPWVGLHGVGAVLRKKLLCLHLTQPRCVLQFCNFQYTKVPSMPPSRMTPCQLTAHHGKHVDIWAAGVMVSRLSLLQPHAPCNIQELTTNICKLRLLMLPAASCWGKPPVTAATGPPLVDFTTLWMQHSTPPAVLPARQLGPSNIPPHGMPFRQRCLASSTDGAVDATSAMVPPPQAATAGAAIRLCAVVLCIFRRKGPQ